LLQETDLAKLKKGSVFLSRIEKIIGSRFNGLNIGKDFSIDRNHVEFRERFGNTAYYRCKWSNRI